MSQTISDWLDQNSDLVTGGGAIIEAVRTSVEIQVALGLMLVGLVMLRLVGSTPKATGRYPQSGQERDIRRPSNTALWRRWWWNVRPPHDLMRVDGLAIDRTRKPHAAWLGPTGAGKSSAVAVVRLDGKRPTLCVMPDLSDPLRDAAERQGQIDGRCLIWTAGKGWPQQPINFLIGTPIEVAERLTEVFRSGGVGVWKRTARMATAQVIRDIDDSKQPRTLHLIGTMLQAATVKDRDLKTVCAGWVSRFLDLADQFGDSIGPDGVDLAKMLKGRMTIILDVDAFEHPGLGGDVVALGLAEAKRCASLVPGGFRLIFEEAGQLGERIDLAEPFFRAGRRRNIPVDALTQAEADLNIGISANVATRCYFAQELKSLQKIAADRLGLDHTHLDPANMRDFSAYISHGKIRRLVRFPKPSSTPKPSYANHPTQLKPETPKPRRIIVAEVAAPWIPPNALPSPRLEVQALLEKMDRSGECWLWTDRKDRDGYGLVWWQGQNRRAHRIVYEQIHGPIGIGPDGKALDLDHRRTCPRHCVRPDHLEPVTRRVNAQRRWRVRGVGQPT